MRILRNSNERCVDKHGPQRGEKLSIALADVRADCVAAACFFLSQDDRVSPCPLGLRKSGPRASVGPAAMIIAWLVRVEASLEREVQTEVGDQEPDVGETRTQLEQRRLSFLAIWATVWKWHPASIATELIDAA